MKTYTISFLGKFFLALVIFITTGCSWDLDNQFKKSSYNIKKMALNFYDANELLNITIRNQFRLNGIELVSQKSLDSNISILNIFTSTFCQNAISFFQDGKISEYQIVFIINANIKIPKFGIYPINTKICRTFFDNTQTALAKLSQQKLIFHEIYKEIAEELIRKIFIISNQRKISIQ